VGSDWTRDTEVWNSFKQQLLNIPGLNNIHFMGGETLLTDRFEDLVDTLIEHQRFETCFSFVTNGTVFRPELISKLTKFRRVGIEVSIETVDDHNAYQRQGTDTAQVLLNIDRYLTVCNNTNVTVSLRPAISALTIGYFDELLMYALNQGLTVKSLQVNTPRFLDAAILPIAARQQYTVKYQNILNQLDSIKLVDDYNASDPNNYQLVVKQQAQMCINMLSQSEPQDVEQLRVQFVDHCKKWDKIYNYNARLLYPELAEIWNQYGY
jgi:sulfatase maturation enzyme AslB (radical SAM superfamily)